MHLAKWEYEGCKGETGQSKLDSQRVKNRCMSLWNHSCYMYVPESEHYLEI